jgi:hypothetical protein
MTMPNDKPLPCACGAELCERLYGGRLVVDLMNVGRHPGCELCQAASLRVSVGVWNRHRADQAEHAEVMRLRGLIDHAETVRQRNTGEGRITVRDACRHRHPLDGTDAQALENALTITERERDAAQMQNENLLVDLEGLRAEAAERNDALLMGRIAELSGKVERDEKTIARLRAEITRLEACCPAAEKGAREHEESAKLVLGLIDHPRPANDKLRALLAADESRERPRMILLPCLVCGHDPYFQMDEGLVNCFNPECAITGIDFTPEQWNRRAPDPLVLRLARALHGMVQQYATEEDTKGRVLFAAPWEHTRVAIVELCQLGILIPLTGYTQRLATARDTTPPWDGETMPEIPHT